MVFVVLSEEKEEPLSAWVGARADAMAVQRSDVSVALASLIL